MVSEILGRFTLCSLHCEYSTCSIGLVDVGLVQFALCSIVVVRCDVTPVLCSGAEEEARGV